MPNPAQFSELRWLHGCGMSLRVAWLHRNPWCEHGGYVAAVRGACPQLINHDAKAVGAGVGAWADLNTDAASPRVPCIGSGGDGGKSRAAPSTHTVAVVAVIAPPTVAPASPPAALEPLPVRADGRDGDSGPHWKAEAVPAGKLALELDAAHASVAPRSPAATASPARSPALAAILALLPMLLRDEAKEVVDTCRVLFGSRHRATSISGASAVGHTDGVDEAGGVTGAAAGVPRPSRHEASAQSRPPAPPLHPATPTAVTQAAKAAAAGSGWCGAAPSGEPTSGRRVQVVASRGSAAEHG